MKNNNCMKTLLLLTLLLMTFPLPRCTGLKKMSAYLKKLLTWASIEKSTAAFNC